MKQEEQHKQTNKPTTRQTKVMCICSAQLAVDQKDCIWIKASSDYVSLVEISNILLRVLSAEPEGDARKVEVKYVQDLIKANSSAVNNPYGSEIMIHPILKDDDTVSMAIRVLKV